MSLLTNQKLKIEAAATPFAFAAMTDSGDHLTFSTTKKPWSRADSEPVFGGYGVVTGGAVTPAISGTNNLVDAAAVEVFAPAMTGANTTTGKITVAADTDLTCTRGATTNTHIINSITVDSSGAYAVVAGTATTAFSETRGASGGPPFIPVGSVEVAQVRLTSVTSAPITADEIFAAPGVHQERYDNPDFTPDYLRGTLTFTSALPLIHTGSVAKKVYVRGATPIFSDLNDVKDWVPSESNDSVTSDTNYDRTIAASISSTLNAATFSLAMKDGVTDFILSLVGKLVTLKFYPNINGTAYQLTQGYLSKTRAFPVKGNPTASFTVAAEQASVDFTS